MTISKGESASEDIPIRRLLVPDLDGLELLLPGSDTDVTVETKEGVETLLRVVDVLTDETELLRLAECTLLVWKTEDVFPTTD